ncbi:MAG TPA: hypothetical protein VNA14_04505 [Mycobacteriales bacterium]|nr:hypothetical protein [Mycobacteriales bacterium]
MQCPTCNADTEVKRSRASDDGSRVVRTRQCKATASHRFETVERRGGHSLDLVCIRQSGSGELAKDPFRKARLLQDVRDSVLKRLNDSQVYEVVNAAVHDLEAHLPELIKPLAQEEQAENPGYVGAIRDTDITDAVERHLRRSPSRIAHVLYALAIRGRSDRRGREGWTNATDVLTWLAEPDNYPDLVVDVPVQRERPVDEWVTGSRPPQPRRVIKRDGVDVDFRIDKFRPGIDRALFGRPELRLHAAGVAQWVLWGVAGQSHVTAAQLGVGVLDALRRVDDIAYLRWSIVHKRIESVAVFVEEVRGLIESPSPQLLITSPARARPEELRGPVRRRG